jgi:hypothetical protein
VELLGQSILALPGKGLKASSHFKYISCATQTVSRGQLAARDLRVERFCSGFLGLRVLQSWVLNCSSLVACMCSYGWEASGRTRDNFDSDAKRITHSTFFPFLKPMCHI